MPYPRCGPRRATETSTRMRVAAPIRSEKASDHPAPSADVRRRSILSLIAVVALVALLAVGSFAGGVIYLDLKAPVQAPDVPLGLAVAPGQTAVGTLTFTDGKTTFFATLVYARVTAKEFNERLHALDPFVDENGIPRTLPCAGPLCTTDPVEQDTQKLYDHLHDAAKKLGSDLGLTDVDLSQARIDGSDAMIVVSFGHAETPRSPSGTSALAPMDELVKKLKAACPDEASDACIENTITLSMHAVWDPAFDRFSDHERPAGTTVLGPLSWTAVKTAAVNKEVLDEASAKVRPSTVKALVFLPTSILIVLLLGFLASFLVNPISSLFGGEPVFPTPLLGAAVGVAGYLLVANGWYWGSAWLFLALLFLTVYTIAFFVYRAQPPSLLDTFSALWAIVTLALTAWWVVHEIIAIRLLEPLALLDLLFGADLHAQGERLFLGTILLLAWGFLVGILVILGSEIFGRLDAGAAPEERTDLGTAYVDRRDTWSDRGFRTFLLDTVRRQETEPERPTWMSVPEPTAIGAAPPLRGAQVDTMDTATRRKERYRLISRGRRGV